MCRSATQEIPNIICHPKVHYRVNKSPPLNLILCQIYPVHIIICNCCEGSGSAETLTFHVPNFYPKKLFQFVVLCNIYPYTVIANPLSFLLHSSKKQYFRNVLYFSVTLPVKTDRLVLSNPQLALYDPTVHAKLHLTHPNLPQILLFL